MPVDDIVNQATDKMVQQGKSWFSSLVSAPLDLPKGAAEGIFKSLMGVGKGFFSNTFGNLFGTLTTGGILLGLANFAPSIVYWISNKIGPVKDGKTIAEIYVEDKNNGGIPKVLMDAGIAAVLINGTVGAVSGAVSGTMDSGEGAEKGFMEKTGGYLGGAATLAGIGFLAYSAISSTKVGAVTAADNGTKTPVPTPPKPLDGKSAAINN